METLSLLLHRDLALKKVLTKPFWHLFDYELVTEPDGIYVRGDSTHTYALCARFDDGPVNSTV